MKQPRYYSGDPFLKLPFCWDVEELKKDLSKAITIGYNDHFNQNGYAGNWKAINLRSLNGSQENIMPGVHASDVYMDTRILVECPYFIELLNSFECDKQSVRILNLTAGSDILEHSDYEMGYEDGYLRVHVPIYSTDDVHFYIDNQRVEMKQGECWYGNFNRPHRVSNKGESDRIHLVMDMVRNDWTDQMMKESGYSFTNESIAPTMDSATAQKVINSLKERNEPAAQELIQQLKALI